MKNKKEKKLGKLFTPSVIISLTVLVIILV